MVPNALQIIQSINQSINQSNFYSVKMPRVGRLRGVIAALVFNSKIDKAVRINAPLTEVMSMGERPSHKGGFFLDVS